jgi:hypothetical protein
MRENTTKITVSQVKKLVQMANRQKCGDKNPESMFTVGQKTAERLRKEVEGAGDGRTSNDCRVPVCRTPMGYRVPGLLRNTRARKPAGWSQCRTNIRYENRKVEQIR